MQESLFSDEDKYLETRSIGCSDKTAELCACIEKRISLLVNMLIELYSEDEDPWALRKHQGTCCNLFIIRFTIFIEFKSYIHIIYTQNNFLMIQYITENISLFYFLFF